MREITKKQKKFLDALPANYTKYSYRELVRIYNKKGFIFKSPESIYQNLLALKNKNFL